MVAAADRARARRDTVMTRGTLFWLVAAVAAVTVVSGIVLIQWPGEMLGLLDADRAPAARHLFGVVGMFMALFGGALLHALFGARRAPIVVLWSGLQKIGAVCGMAIGVAHGIFAPLALGVAGFDFVSAVLIFAYLVRMARR
jgi:hypothetical protein